MRAASTAHVKDVLVFYDEAQLLLLATERFPMIAVAIERQGMQHPFFACEVRAKTLSRYMEQKADLHYVFSQGVGGLYYFFDLGEVKADTVALARASKEEAQQPTYWPTHGFFARSHTSLSPAPDVSSARSVFDIDGKWGSADFSRFHGKMSDLYALFSAVARFDKDESGTELAEISGLISSRFWQGGGSYGGFYDDLEARVEALTRRPLEVAAIRYASPGEIVFRGDPNVLAEIAHVISLFVERAGKLNEQYRTIRGVLRKENLLSAKPDTGFSSEAIKNYVKSSTDHFAGMMEVEARDKLFAACKESVLVYAKVVLSIYRRARELYSFYDEGRVRQGKVAD